MSFLVLLQYFSYAASPLAAVLAYFHIMGKKEQEEAIRNKFNDEYHPEITDCKAKLHFCKVGVKEKTFSSPGVPHGPGGFHAPLPDKENDPTDPHVRFVILLHGSTAGAPPVNLVALSVIQLL